MLSKNTLPIITEKELEYPTPYGWTKRLEGEYLFERCHIIAYNLSAQNTTKENLFIGTNDLNTSIMKNIENYVNNYIKNNDYNVLYKVKIKYKGADQIPIGILIEAQSIGGNLSVCKFCYNIEKNIKFDYSDGTIIYDNRGLKRLKNKDKNIIKLETSKTKNNKNEKQKKTEETKRNYILNINTKECHHSRDCIKLKNVELKYIQGTRTTEQVILDNGFKICNKCKNNP